MVFIEHNSLKSDIFLIPYLFHIFQDSCFSGSMFSTVQVFQGLGFPRSRFFRVRVQGPDPGFRSSRFKEFDHVFHAIVTAYCQQNRYVRYAIYTDFIHVKSNFDLRT